MAGLSRAYLDRGYFKGVSKILRNTIFRGTFDSIILVKSGLQVLSQVMSQEYCENCHKISLTPLVDL